MSGDLDPCPLRARSHGDSRESPALADKNSLTVHGNASQLTPRVGPHLCKAVLLLIRQGRIVLVADQDQAVKRRAGKKS